MPKVSAVTPSPASYAANATTAETPNTPPPSSRPAPSPWSTASCPRPSPTPCAGTASTATSPRPRPAPKQRRLNQLARSTWTVDELQRFFAWLGDNRYRYPWAFAATSGARRGEILGLRWSDIDLDRATAAIFNQVTTDHDHQVIFKPGSKTGRGHTIHLDPATIALLTEWRQRQNVEKRLLGPAYQDDDYVFCLEDGRHYHPERFSRAFLRKQLQYNQAHPDQPLPRLTIHGLRHTWATIALAEGVHLKVVSDRLNHSTTHITAEVYSHVTEPISRDAADLVGGLILGETQRAPNSDG